MEDDLDLEVSALIEELARRQEAQSAGWTVEERRAAMESRTSWLSGVGPDVAAVHEERIEGMKVRIYQPGATSGSLLLFLHGGGWVCGSLDTHDAMCRELATRAGCTVASLDYPLAPENRYPVALQALDRVVRMVLDSRRLPGWDGERLGIGGDSAGGTLAAVLARRHRQHLALQLLIYPILDQPTPPIEDVANAKGTLTFGDYELRWSWDLYCPDPARRASSDAAPLRASDLSGLPPMVMVVASHDVLANEGSAYARNAAAAGVPVDLVIGHGMPHGFLRMTNVLAGARIAMDTTAMNLHRRFGLGIAIGPSPAPGERA